ncbi:hypothetical protein [Ruminiclostridium cellobioparum]|jgi:hypothetical protein|uniref:Uncharacterized protein n=1 Tax=Ruminiclostridium cellobioparum subsp. termitidis CT1112 TaxID=1195236 RepID=S0FGT5_RUMCE|nr:hypothetical protein [Ruminiclostridium cellobioparum]EMS70805.1 hypothetical protein CTER_3483 [Ruminiclostridium cellobioparum subsp. termitidis CT1112]
MEQLRSVIEMLKKINSKNSSVLDSCKEEKLQKDIEYENLFQSYWSSNLRVSNVVVLLEAIEKELSAIKL